MSVADSDVMNTLFCELDNLQERITQQIDDNSNISNFQLALLMANLYKMMSDRLTILALLQTTEFSESQENALKNIMKSVADDGDILGHLVDIIKLDEYTDELVENKLKEIANNGLQCK